MLMFKYPILGLSYGRGFYAVSGGGGSLKSGIPNTVDIYELSSSDPSGFAKVMSADTGRRLASGATFSHDGLLVAASVSSMCWVYELDREEKTMKELVRFRTDFAESESSQSCVCFVGNATLLTGGEDGVVRQWKISQEPSAIDKASGTSASLECPEEGNTTVPDAPRLGDIAINGSTMVTLTREYRGHTKRIRDIHVEPSHRNLVVTSSEDQSCHLWRLSEFLPICKLSKEDAVDLATQTLGLKRPFTPYKHQFRCVRFSHDGRRLYTVLTPPRGDAFLIKWKPETICQVHTSQWNWIIESVRVTSERPVAALCVSLDDCFVATADVSGEVRVYLCDELVPYARQAKAEHNIAITGMSFADPPKDKNAKVCHLVTGSADKLLLRHDIPLEGGVLARGGLTTVVNNIKAMLSAIIGLVLSGFLSGTILFIVMLFIHAKHAILLNGPLSGFEEVLDLRLDSYDAWISLVLTFLCLVIMWLSSVRMSLTNAFFWNGFVCLFSALVAFLVAVSPELNFTWKTGNHPVDELLDYKISIILGGCCIIFFFCHSLLVMLR